MTKKEFANGWSHFCGCINFDSSALDAEAIRFMNEMPAEVANGLTPNKKNEKPGPGKSSEPSSMWEHLH